MIWLGDVCGKRVIMTWETDYPGRHPALLEYVPGAGSKHTTCCLASPVTAQSEVTTSGHSRLVNSDVDSPNE